MWENEFINRYNGELESLKKADDYFSNKGIDDDLKIKSKILNRYNEIIRNLSNMQQEYKDHMEVEMTEFEKFFGFV